MTDAFPHEANVQRTAFGQSASSRCHHASPQHADRGGDCGSRRRRGSRYLARSGSGRMTALTCMRRPPTVEARRSLWPDSPHRRQRPCESCTPPGMCQFAGIFGVATKASYALFLLYRHLEIEQGIDLLGGQAGGERAGSGLQHEGRGPTTCRRPQRGVHPQAGRPGVVARP